MKERKKMRVELEKAFIGFELAEDVFKEKNMKLIAKNNLITERLYDSLKKHKVKNIYIYEK